MTLAQFTELCAKAGYPLTANPDGSGVHSFTGFGYTCILFPFLRGKEVDSVQLFCGFDVAPKTEQIDRWSRDNRFVKAYRAANGRLSVEFDFVVDGVTVTGPYLKRIFMTWEYLLSELPSYFN